MFKLAAFAERSEERFSELSRVIQSEGAKFFVQLVEPGRHFAGDLTAPWSASDIPWMHGGPIPHSLSHAEIDQIVGYFGVATERLKDAGVDGIEVNLAHGHLLQQFLSPLSNLRTDEYGVELEGRLRFAARVLSVVRDAAGSSMAVGIRVSASEFTEGGLEPDDVLEAVSWIAARHELDFLHVSHSAYMGQPTLSTQVADMHYGPAPFRDFPKMFKNAMSGIPIIGVCRIDDLELAEELVETGYLDVAAMTRAHIADPYIVRKHLEGRPQEIRRCVACNQGCVAAIEYDRPMSCTVNPRAGFEHLTNGDLELNSIRAGVKLQRSDSQDILVVGAGPGGMEAAITAARAGHQVTVRERSDRSGGNLLVASMLDGRDSWLKLVEDQMAEATRLDVRLEFNLDVSAADLEQEVWDRVVIATGSTWRSYFIEGYGQCMTPDDVLRSREPEATTAKSVVIIDQDGAWAAAGLALHLARRGRTVHIVSERDQFAWNITSYSKLGLRGRISETKRVRSHLMRSVGGFRDGNVELRDVLSGHVEHVENVGPIVWVGPRKAVNGLANELRSVASVGAVHLIGDAYAPRTSLEAVREGSRFLDEAHAVA